MRRTSVETSEEVRPRCGVVSSRPEMVDALAALLATWLPAGDIAVLDAAPRGPGDLELVVVAAEDDDTTLELAREARARGHRGALLVLLAGSKPEWTARLGAKVAPAPWSNGPGTSPNGVAVEAFGAALAAALRDSERGAEATPAVIALRDMVAESRRLLAVGAQLSDMLHRMNNPLTALLAEAQLLALEEGLAPETREAVGRIEAMARRLAELTRAFGK